MLSCAHVYIQNGCDTDWEASNYPIKGMEWAQSEEPVTLGMWMWSRPYVITLPDNRYQQHAHARPEKVTSEKMLTLFINTTNLKCQRI